MSESHDRNCASRWSASAECDCGADRVNASEAIHALESVNLALEARVAELESTNAYLRKMLYNCAAHAGMPEPTTGCRAIIATVKDALAIP